MGRPTLYTELTTRVHGWITDHASHIFEKARKRLMETRDVEHASDGNTVEYVLREWSKMDQRKK